IILGDCPGIHALRGLRAIGIVVYSRPPQEDHPWTETCKRSRTWSSACSDTTAGTRRCPMLSSPKRSRSSSTGAACSRASPPPGPAPSQAPAPAPPSALREQPDPSEHAPAVHGLAHVVDGERGHRDRRHRLHFHSRCGARRDLRLDANAPLAREETELDADRV